MQKKGGVWIKPFVSALLFCTFMVITKTSAFAAPNFGWNDFNGSGGQGLEGLYSDVNGIVLAVIAFGALWVVACLVFAGAKLSAAQGKPENRTQGFIGLAMAFVGGYVIVKAFDIAGYIADFGA